MKQYKDFEVTTLNCDFARAFVDNEHGKFELEVDKLGGVYLYISRGLDGDDNHIWELLKFYELQYNYIAMKLYNLIQSLNK